MNDKSEEKVVSKLLKINWPDAGSAQFANNMLVQTGDGVLHLVFYQLNPPLVVAENHDEYKKSVEALSTIDAVPVARIAMPISKLDALIDALSKQRDQSKVTK